MNKACRRLQRWKTFHPIQVSDRLQNQGRRSPHKVRGNRWWNNAPSGVRRASLRQLTPTCGKLPHLAGNGGGVAACGAVASHPRIRRRCSAAFAGSQVSRTEQFRRPGVPAWIREKAARGFVQLDLAFQAGIS